MQLIECLKTTPLKYKTAIFITIETGSRLSELAGLKWSDVNFKTNKLDISRQRQYVSGYGIFEKSPKTESGTRGITLTGSVTTLLAAYKKEQLENKMRMGNLWQESPNIFVHEDGKPIHPHRPYTWFTELFKKNRLDKITFHQLRHTNASILIAEGMDVVTVSGRLGHSDKNVTLNTYSHIIEAKEQEAATRMEKYYGDSIGISPAIKI